MPTLNSFLAKKTKSMVTLQLLQPFGYDEIEPAPESERVQAYGL